MIFKEARKRERRRKACTPARWRYFWPPRRRNQSSAHLPFRRGRGLSRKRNSSAVLPLHVLLALLFGPCLATKPLLGATCCMHPPVFQLCLARLLFTPPFFTECISVCSGFLPITSEEITTYFYYFLDTLSVVFSFEYIGKIGCVFYLMFLPFSHLPCIVIRHFMCIMSIFVMINLHTLLCHFRQCLLHVCYCFGVEFCSCPICIIHYAFSCYFCHHFYRFILCLCSPFHAIFLLFSTNISFHILCHFIALHHLHHYLH